MPLRRSRNQKKKTKPDEKAEVEAPGVLQEIQVISLTKPLTPVTLDSIELIPEKLFTDQANELEKKKTR